MSIKVMTRVWDQSKQKGSALLLLLAIADHAADDGYCWPGIKTLAGKIRMSERSVMRLVKSMEEDDELYVVRSNANNRYVVTVGMTKDVLHRILLARGQPIPGDNLSPDKMTRDNGDGAGDTCVTSEVTQPCHPNLHDPSLNRQEHGASALAFTDAVPDEYGIYTATMTDESDEQIDCPHCANPIVVARQPNARGTCPHCEEGLRINDPHGHIHKKGKRKPLTLGSLFGDCPDHMAPLRVRVEQIEDLRMVHGVEPEHLWKAVQWSAGLVGKDSNTSSRFLIDRALVWAQREANATIAASGEVASDLETVPLPELRARLAGGELRMDDLDAGEQAVVLARLGALP